MQFVYGFLIGALLGAAFGIWRGRIYWGDVLTKAQAVARDARVERDDAKALITKVKGRAAELKLDVKKAFPFLVMLLAFCFAVCGRAQTTDQDAKPQAARTPMQELQLRKIRLTYELLAARINHNDTNEAFAEQLLDDVHLEMAWLADQSQGAGVSYLERDGAPHLAPAADHGSVATATYWHHGAAILPDPKVTMGMVERGLTKEVLCDPSFHTGTVRNVPESEKRAACREYGISEGCPGKGYELDHLISIELGGSNDLANLWPQPVDAPGVIGFHTKDVVENRAHRAVCDGRLTLAQAQEGIRLDWYGFGLANGFIGPEKAK